MNLKFKFEVYYDETFDIDYDPYLLFKLVDRRWFNFYTFCCGGFIYCDEVVCFDTEAAREHFIWLIKNRYPDIKVVRLVCTDEIGFTL